MLTSQEAHTGGEVARGMWSCVGLQGHSCDGETDHVGEGYLFEAYSAEKRTVKLVSWRISDREVFAVTEAWRRGDQMIATPSRAGDTGVVV